MITKTPTLNAILWNLAKAIGEKTNCKKRSVGCVIFDEVTGDVEAVGHNVHENGKCDCSTTKTALHAEIEALANLPKDVESTNLIAMVTHRPCDQCNAALAERVKEVRYIFQ